MLATPLLIPALRHDIGWLVPIHAEHARRGTTLDGHHPLPPLITTWLLINQQMAETGPANLPRRSQRPAPEVRIVQDQAAQRHPDSGRHRIRRHRPRTSQAKPDHRFWVSRHERTAPAAASGERSTSNLLKGDEDPPIKLSTTVRVLGNRTTDRRSNNDND
jgi:hypothetical protein